MTRDITNASLEERVREYLTRFPHRDTDMSKYGVCRDWLISVIQAEAEWCAKIASDTRHVPRSERKYLAESNSPTALVNVAYSETAHQIRRAYGLNGKKE